MSDIAQATFEANEIMYRFKQERNYQELVQEMINSMKFIKGQKNEAKLKDINQQADVDLQIESYKFKSFGKSNLIKED